MARSTSPKVGRGPCPGYDFVKQAPCGETVTFRRSAGGMLTHKCDVCDSAGYAEANGRAYKARMASLTELADSEESAPAAGGETTLAKPRTASAFELGNL